MTRPCRDVLSFRRLGRYCEPMSKSDVGSHGAPFSTTYETLVKRNAGFITQELQDKIRGSRLLVAGCGIGSTIAEASVRIGFERITLVDADTIEAHNLNRQIFTASDVGHKKVHALGRRLKAINPELAVREIDGLVDGRTAPDLVADSDLVLDTIDFLDISGIVALHDECRAQGKPIVSCASAGWGAVATYFPPDGDVSFRELFGLPANGPVDDCSYVQCFGTFTERLRDILIPDVMDAIAEALGEMEDDRPCPAPHISVGATTAAALAVTTLVRLIAGEPVTAAPRMMVADMSTHAVAAGIDLTP